MNECQRVEVGPSVLRKYIEFLARAEPYRGTLSHEFCKEQGHVESPTLTRAFDRAAAELAVRHIIDSANQMSVPKLDFRGLLSLDGSRSRVKSKSITTKVYSIHQSTVSRRGRTELD